MVENLAKGGETMLVSKQSNYYDDGAFSVEIAAQLDYVGPGALAGSISQEFDDPREAAEYAITLRKEWWKNDWTWIPFTLSMNGMIYATVNDGLTAAGLRRWAKEQYEKMPKCEYCSQIPAVQYTDHEYFATAVACCEDHADRLFNSHHNWEEEVDV
jgi:hypothetical protein